MAVAPNAVAFTAASAGTGTFVFASAVPASLTLAEAVSLGALEDGDIVAYGAVDLLTNPTKRAWGIGTFHAAGSGSITRDPNETWVTASSFGTGSPLNFTTPPIVYSTILREYIAPPLPGLPSGAPIADADIGYWAQAGVAVKQAASALWTYIQTKIVAVFNPRTVLTGNATFYVDAATGSDSNDGSIGAPWATPQHAMQVIADSYDLGGFLPIVNIAAGTYDGISFLPLTGGNIIQFIGAGVGSTIIAQDPTAGWCFGSDHSMSGCLYAIIEATLDGSANLGPVVEVSDYTKVATINLITGTPGSIEFVNNTGNSTIYLAGAYAGFYDAQANVTISGDGYIFFDFETYSYGQIGGDYTLSGTINFSFSFLFMDVFAGAQFYGSFSGAATGPSYSITNNSSVQAFGGGFGVLPGDGSGIIDQSSSFDDLTFAQPTQGGGPPTTADLPEPDSRGVFVDSSGSIYSAVNVSGTIKEIARALLAADADFYVDASTGSDSNAGSSGSPWATLQHAYNVVSGTLDGQGIYGATINLVGAGPYTLDVENGTVGMAFINVIGADSATTKLNDLVTGWTNTFELGTVLNFDSLTYGYTAAFEGTIGHFALGVVAIGAINGDTVINPGGFTFGCSGAGVQLQLYGNVTITAGTAHNFYSASEDSFIYLGGPIVTLTGTPDFDFAFAAAQLGGFIDGQGETYSGPATGTRFFASAGARLFSFTPTETFYPGNSEGILITGGDFVGLVRHQILTPTTGSTVTMSFLQPTALLTPAGTLATLTVVLPPLPGSGFIDLNTYNSYNATVSTTQAITALTVTTSDGSTIAGAPTTLEANTGFSWEWDATTNVWYPLVGSEGGGGGRTVLTGNATINVNGATGSDSYTVAQYLAGMPAATLQHAVNVISANLDIAGFIITIAVAAGSYVGFGMPSCVGGGQSYFNGAGYTSTTITAGPNDGVLNYGECVTTQFEGTWLGLNNLTCDGSTITSSDASGTIAQFTGSTILFFAPDGSGGDIGLVGSGLSLDLPVLYNESSKFYDFNPFPGAGTVHISGDAEGYAEAINSAITQLFSTYVFTGTPTYDGYVLRSGELSQILYQPIGLTGSVTGASAKISLNAIIDTFGNGPTSIPGDGTVLIETGGEIDTGGPNGISVTITTAALTTLGAQGSMTFVNGVLTAQTQAT